MQSVQITGQRSVFFDNLQLQLWTDKMPKKQPKNAFFYFMLHFKEEERRRGRQFNSLADVSAAASKPWQVKTSDFLWLEFSQKMNFFCRSFTYRKWLPRNGVRLRNKPRIRKSVQKRKWKSTRRKESLCRLSRKNRSNRNRNIVRWCVQFRARLWTRLPTTVSLRRVDHAMDDDDTWSGSSLKFIFLSLPIKQSRRKSLSSFPEIILSTWTKTIYQPRLRW